MMSSAFSQATFALISFLFLGGVRSADPVCSDGNEFIAHPNCSLYYQCSNGIPLLIECPDFLYWSDDLQACDFPANVPECEGGTRVPTTTQVMTSTSTTTEVTTSTPTTPTTTEVIITTQPPEVLRCGGILRNTSGIVSYKPESTLDPNERCIWTIHSPGAFTFTLLTNGSDTPSVVVTLIRRLNATLTMGSFTPNNLNETSIGDADVVVITAFSGESPVTSKGFSLSYVSIPSGDNLPQGNHEIHSALPISTGHPQESSDMYDDNDLSTFAFAPNNYRSSPYNVTYTPRTESTSVCPGDTIYAFEFDITGSGSGILLHWTEFQGQCVSSESWRKQTSEAVLIVFRSDFSLRGVGFNIAYT